MENAQNFQRKPRPPQSQQQKRPRPHPQQQRYSKPYNQRSGGQQGGRSLSAQCNTLQQNLDRYLGLARDAGGSGERVLAESYFQYAEHYLRSLNEIKILIEQERPREVETPQESSNDTPQEGTSKKNKEQTHSVIQEETPCQQSEDSAAE